MNLWGFVSHINFDSHCQRSFTAWNPQLVQYRKKSVLTLHYKWFISCLWTKFSHFFAMKQSIFHIFLYPGKFVANCKPLDSLCSSADVTCDLDLFWIWLRTLHHARVHCELVSISNQPIAFIIKRCIDGTQLWSSVRVIRQNRIKNFLRYQNNWI